jgi:hypothetical protein
MTTELALLTRGTPPQLVLDTLEHLDEAPPPFTRVRCPLCAWQPTAADRWLCARQGPPENYDGGCGTAWNTFLTRGRCPGCDHQWRWTACLSCHGWAPHDDWYAQDEDA